MSVFLPPPPNPNLSTDDYVWRDWFRKLRDYLVKAGSFAWSIIDFTGSNLTDIETRNHNDLQNIQGGTTNEYYHLTNAEYTLLQNSDNVQFVAVNTTLTDTYPTTVVTSAGCTMTLPAASTNRIGKVWTVINKTTGSTTVQRAGADTIATPTSLTDTSVIIAVMGTSVSFECLTSSTWGLV